MLVSILKDFKEDIIDVIRRNQQDDENQGVGCSQIAALCISNWIEVKLLHGSCIHMSFFTTFGSDGKKA